MIKLKDVQRDQPHDCESAALIEQEATRAERDAEQDYRFREDEHWIRTRANSHLAIISVWWLFFTSLVVIFQGFDYYWFSLSDSVMITFLTTSLGTVLGLWGIGLGYYFFIKK
jgi:hypothetical protein